MKLPRRIPPISLEPDYIYRDVGGRWQKVHISDLPRDESRESYMRPSGGAISAVVSVSASGGCGT